MADQLAGMKADWRVLTEVDWRVVQRVGLMDRERVDLKAGMKADQWVDSRDK
jgi:hypothetical protein